MGKRARRSTSSAASSKPASRPKSSKKAASKQGKPASSAPSTGSARVRAPKKRGGKKNLPVVEQAPEDESEEVEEISIAKFGQEESGEESEGKSGEEREDGANDDEFGGLSSDDEDGEGSQKGGKKVISNRAMEAASSKARIEFDKAALALLEKKGGKKKSKRALAREVKVRKDEEEANRKLRPDEWRGAGTSKDKGVVYLGHIPYGFFEGQIKKFFSQFGSITRLRLSRSKKTGGSKGYAFIEFQKLAVAKIVAHTFDNYMMFGRTLRCELVPKHKLHDKTFKGANKTFVKKDTRAMARARYNRDQGKEAHTKRVQRLLKRQTKKRKAIAALGIDYEFGGYTTEKSN